MVEENEPSPVETTRPVGQMQESGLNTEVIKEKKNTDAVDGEQDGSMNIQEKKENREEGKGKRKEKRKSFVEPWEMENVDHYS